MDISTAKFNELALAYSPGGRVSGGAASVSSAPESGTKVDTAVKQQSEAASETAAKPTLAKPLTAEEEPIPLGKEELKKVVDEMSIRKVKKRPNSGQC